VYRNVIVIYPAMRSLRILSVRKEAKLSASEVREIRLEQSVIIGA